jgi:rare lipoprotein A
VALICHDKFVWEGYGMRAFVVNIASCFGFVFGTGFPAAAAIPPPDSALARQEAQQLDQLPAVAPFGKAPIDHSGRKQKGKASYYAGKFAHGKMADGHRMNPQANMAASKTLPLGTTAKVINLQNGKSATVRVEDRGPFVAGRVMDVTFKVAQELDMGKHGVVPVEVKPITVPQPNGDVKLVPTFLLE